MVDEDEDGVDDEDGAPVAKVRVLYVHILLSLPTIVLKTCVC